MRVSTTLLPWSSLFGLSLAACPFAHMGNLKARDDGDSTSRSHLESAEVDDSDGFMTSDVGGPIGEQRSLRAGLRGPTALEDFIFRQKLQRFDHERVRFLTGTREHDEPFATNVVSPPDPRESCPRTRSWCFGYLYQLC